MSTCCLQCFKLIMNKVRLLVCFKSLPICFWTVNSTEINLRQNLLPSTYRIKSNKKDASKTRHTKVPKVLWLELYDVLFFPKHQSHHFVGTGFQIRPYKETDFFFTFIQAKVAQKNNHLDNRNLPLFYWKSLHKLLLYRNENTVTISSL